MTNVAPSASTAEDRSAAGSACTSEPPNVSRWRICRSPTSAATCGSNGTSRRRSRGFDDITVTGRGTDRDLVAIDPDVGQLRDPAEVDEYTGLGKAQLEDR
jgi:hypothetical protein